MVGLILINFFCKTTKRHTLNSECGGMIHPIIHLLAGINERSFVVNTQQTKDNRAITGIANHTGRRGCAGSPATMALPIGARKRMCIRYIPNVLFEMEVIHFGACLPSMQVKRRKAPNVARTTFGVQNSHPHSSVLVSITFPGTPCHQNDHAVKNAPTKKLTAPT